MFKNRIKGKTAIVTGATSGIGKSVARDLAALGTHLILTGRREDRLIAIQNELSSNFPVEVKYTCFDIRDRNSCKHFFDLYSNRQIDILINNAGLAKGADSVTSASINDWDEMIQTNLNGLISLTRLFTPGMVKMGVGHIINIGSIAGHESYPGGSVYCATKHAVTAFTKSLKMDLNGTGIRVSLVSPGLVNTEFSKVRFSGDQVRADKVYEGLEPLSADDISEIILFILNQPDHVNIMDVLVYPTDQASSIQVARNRNA